MLPQTLASVPGIGAQLKDGVDGLANRLLTYTKLGKYYAGEHPMNYVSAQFRERFAGALNDLADNLCPLVVDTISGRLIVSGFTPSGTEVDNFLRESRFDAKQRQIHRDAVHYGDAYAILWDDGKGPRLYRQRPWQIAPIYDDSDSERMIAAVKTWEVGTANEKRRRITIYYEDRVERYITQAKVDALSSIATSSLIPFEEDGEDAVQPHDFKRVPVFHWANGAGLGEFGWSELMAVIPLQDMLNKALYDLVVGMEASAYPQRFATGIEVQIDPATGKPIMDWAPSKLWTSGNPDAKFGQLPGGEFQGNLAVAESTRLQIARVSSVPTYFFGQQGQVPSGAALRVTESPLQTKVESRQVAFGNVWEDLVRTATGQQVDAVWRDTSPVTEMEKAELGAVLDRLGVPKEFVFQRALDVDQEQAQELAQQAEEASLQREERAAARMFRAPELP